MFVWITIFLNNLFIAHLLLQTENILTTGYVAWANWYILDSSPSTLIFVGECIIWG